MISLDDIDAAVKRIAPHIRRTPLVAATALNESPTPASLWLKLECPQVTGSFKARGATNKLLATPSEELAGGVVAAPGGNHGLAADLSGAAAVAALRMGRLQLGADRKVCALVCGAGPEALAV